DNIRVDSRLNRVFVGYGSGALAVIDPAQKRKLADIPLKAHPEGFQLAEGGSKIFVNLPDARQIAEVDPLAGKQVLAISTVGRRPSSPRAADDDLPLWWLVSRSPPRLSAYASQDGKPIASVETCSDADDVFVDPKRHRVYVSCGEGAVDVLADRDSRYERL